VSSVFIIVDDQHVDAALTDQEWATIKRMTLPYPILASLADGEEVCSEELLEAAETMHPCPQAIQTLVAYGLAGSSLRVSDGEA